MLNTIPRFVQHLGANNLGPKDHNMVVELLRTRRFAYEDNVFNAHSVSWIEYHQWNHPMNGIIFWHVSLI